MSYCPHSIVFTPSRRDYLMKTLSSVKAFMIATAILVPATTASYATTNAQTDQQLPNLLTDLEILAGKKNPQRLRALAHLLEKSGISYNVEPYTYTKADVFGDKTELSDKAQELWNSLSGEGGNLVVELGSGNETIIVGAHYDRVPIGAGVVDNGASSIILVRLAEALQYHPLTYRLKIVWFGDEEINLIGSKKFVVAHKDENIVSMINLDVNAYGNTTMMGPTKYTGLNRLYDMAQDVCRKHGFKFIEFPEYGESDNENFTAEGVEAISIGIAPTAEAYDFWLALNADEGLKPKHMPRLITNIHSERDSMSRIDPQSMSQSYLVTLGILQALNERP